MASDPDKTEKDYRQSSSSNGRAEVEHRDHAAEPSSQPHEGLGDDDHQRMEASSKLENPLAGLSPQRLREMGEEYCRNNDITDEEDIRAFRLGAVVAGNMNKFDTVEGLTDHERRLLERETTHKWSNPKKLYWVIASKRMSPKARV